MLNQPPLFVRRWLSCDAKKDEISQFCHQKSVRTEPRGGRSLLSFYPLSTSFPDLLEHSVSFSHLQFRERERKKALFISVLGGRTYAAFACKVSKMCFIQNCPMPLTELGLRFSSFLNLFISVVFKTLSWSIFPCFVVGLGNKKTTKKKPVQMFFFMSYFKLRSVYWKIMQTFIRFAISRNRVCI